MKKLTKQQKENIIKKIQEDKPISDEFRFLIPFETEKEYELTYAGKERKEDILADTLSVPFQPIKKFGEAKENEWQNMLIFGDNSQALKHLLKLKEQGKLRNPDGRNGVKLIYIDPPFASDQEFKGKKDQEVYKDKIAGAEFLEFLRKRLIFIKELMTDDGSLFVHIDYRKGHYIKVILDEIFGEKNLVNEIVWHFRTYQGQVQNYFPKKHHAIYWYKKQDRPRFELRYLENFKETVDYKRWKDFIVNGCEIRANNYPKSDSRFMAYYDRWVEDNGREPSGNEVIYKVQGYVIDDVWDIQQVDPKDKYERVDFAPGNQKPEMLLNRIIDTCSSPGDIIMDCFAGTGTLGAVADKLNRRWIMIDSGKFAIYTIQKRMLHLREGIGNRGKLRKPKPFVLYNAGLYLDSGFIEKMDETDYRKFVLELFSAEPSDNKVKGVQMHGILNNRPVMVFSQKDYLTHEFIDDLHKTIGSGLKDEMYIVAPQSVVRFNEDYRDKGKIRYHVLKVPYSIIQKILEKNFIRGLQPLSKTNINQTIESVGFDFIYPPKVECEYYQGKEKILFDNLVIKIKKFKPVQISKKPVEFEDPKKEALSMVVIDEDYDGKIFDMDHYFFGDEIVKNDFKVVFPKQKTGQKLMIIYLDVLGNEKVEVKDIKDFKKK